MKFLFLWNALKRRLSNRCFNSRDRRCAERMRPFLLLFKLNGIFANDISEGRLKRCSCPFYGICVFWITVYISYVCFLLYNYLISDSITIRWTVKYVKHIVGYMSLSINVIVSYTSQNDFAKVRKLMVQCRSASESFPFLKCEFSPNLPQFFDRMDHYDYVVARMNKKRKDNSWIPWIATFLVTSIVLLLVSIMIFKVSWSMLFSVAFPDFSTTIMQMFGTLEIFLMLRLLLERFRHINDKIAPYVSWNEERYASRMITATDLKMLYSILHDAQRAFKDIYENFLLVCFASLMIHLFANICAFQETTSLIACAFVVPPIAQLLILCMICQYTAEEV